MKLRLETWKSDENREERHYFLKDFQPSGYQSSPYVFGINPQIVTEDQVRMILEMLNGDLP